MLAGRCTAKAGSVSDLVRQESSMRLGRWRQGVMAIRLLETDR